MAAVWAPGPEPITEGQDQSVHANSAGNDSMGSVALTNNLGVHHSGGGYAIDARGRRQRVGEDLGRGRSLLVQSRSRSGSETERSEGGRETAEGGGKQLEGISRDERKERVISGQVGGQMMKSKQQFFVKLIIWRCRGPSLSNHPHVMVLDRADVSAITLSCAVAFRFRFP